jgi:hypothetical protein
MYDWMLSAWSEVRPITYLHLFGPLIANVPMHSHPADGITTIVVGELIETYRPRMTDPAGQNVRHLRPGDIVIRRAKEGHHLALAPGCDYAITLYTFGRRCVPGWAGAETSPL